jgi:iron complex transport system permease protein
VIARRVTWTLIAAATLVAAAMASIAFGARDVGIDEILGGLAGQTDTIGEASVNARVPRTVLAILVGAALGMSGALMQGVTRNPLGDPSILGVSSGAGFAVVIGITFFGITNAVATMSLAIVGAAAASFVVYAIGTAGRGGATPLKLALSGAVTAAALSSLISAMLLSQPNIVRAFSLWLIGGVGGASTEQILVALPGIGIALIVGFAMARGLNSLALGDDIAAGLGEQVWRTRLLAAIAAIVLCGVATAVAGPIAFVGLVIPHLVRGIWGSDYRWVLPLSAAGGAILLTATDVLGRVIARPTEVEAGILTALIGAPVFVVIAMRMKARGL